MSTLRTPNVVGVAAGLAGCLVMAAVAVADAAEGPWLQLRRQTEEEGVAAAGLAIPREAVRVFVYEGTPRSVHVTDECIAAAHSTSGVLFDRDSGKPLRRYTVADGWPIRRPEAFVEKADAWQRPPMVGPGVVNTPAPRVPTKEGEALPAEVATQTQFAGRTWRARQPANFLRNVDRDVNARRPGVRSITWSAILDRLNQASYVEADPGGNVAPQRFTMADGLAGNIVTDLVVCGDSLWAACVDVFDPKREKWGPGGLGRYDQKTGRFSRIARIDGRPVRWVTLLEEIDGELWVGFREGSGVAGDSVTYGMGLYPGVYRPETTAIVLARLVDGNWTTYARAPWPEDLPRGPHPTTAPTATPTEYAHEPARRGDDLPRGPHPTTAPPTPPTEYAQKLARRGDSVVLFSRIKGDWPSGNWQVPMKGHVSLLNLTTRRWRNFDPDKDLGADRIDSMVVADGEILLASDRGLHRFDGESESWQFLDPQCDLRNPVFHAATVAGDELWLGYARQSFFVPGTQGISRFNQRTGKWSYMGPGELGTASPVRRIVTLANGDVWVLFGRRPVISAMILSEAGREPTGLGRFADGKWEFPVKEPPDRQDRRREEYAMEYGDDIAAAGDQLVFLKQSRAYLGPNPWKPLVDGYVIDVAPVSGGKAVEIVRLVPQADDSRPRTYQYGTYEPGAGKVAWKEPTEKVDYTEEPRFRGGYSVQGYYRHAGGEWVRIPAAAPGNWVVGPFGGGYPDYHHTLDAPTAVWIFSRGEVVRLDRKALDDLLAHHATGS